MKNVIIKYRKLISLGKAKVTSSSTADVTNYYQSTDSEFRDFTTIKIKAGDKLYWTNPYTQKLEILGTISTTAGNATKFVMSAHAPVQSYDATKAFGYFIPKVFGESVVVSYPLSLYRGARTAGNLNKGDLSTQNFINYSSSLVSLFFERAPGYLDEIRLRVVDGQGYSAIKEINKFFNKETNKDIIFSSENLKKISSSLLAVDKILSSIAPS